MHNDWVIETTKERRGGQRGGLGVKEGIDISDRVEHRYINKGHYITFYSYSTFQTSLLGPEVSLYGLESWDIPPF